jgi:hypothetical protein
VRYESCIESKIGDEYIFPFTDRNRIFPNIMLAPNQPNTIRIDIAEMVDCTHARGKFAYIWGRLDYTDAFCEPRFMTFQMAYDFGPLQAFGVCAAGNDAD